MSRTVSAPHPLLRPLQGLGQRLFGLLLVVGLGWLLGTQYVSPNKRVLAVLAAIVIAGIAWRIDMISGIGLLIFALLYPRGTVFGNTNFALLLLVLVIWLVRVSLGQIAGPRRTPVDAAIAGILIAYIVSFRNIEPSYGNEAFSVFLLVLASVLTFYLIVNNVRTNEDLMRLHFFQLIALASACLFAAYELNHPGGTLIPGWIDFRNTTGTEFDTHNIRVGGPFGDFELMSEYSALSLLLVSFLWVRANSKSRRFVLGAIGLLVMFILFATVTRGSIFALGAGLVYALWYLRRRLRLVPLVIAITVLISGFLAMNFYVANFTRSGNLIERLSETKFVGGIPDSRVGAWQGAWGRFLEHPIIGHGPVYTLERGIYMWAWPHNIYLYIANIIGLVGLTMFLLLFWKLWRISSPTTDDLRHPSYARAFLLVAHVQLFVFLVDEIKIDFLRNIIYQFQPWILFASIVAAHRIVSQEREVPMQRVPSS
jgi:hypothetical protein